MASEVHFGNLAFFMSATSEAIKMWFPVYVDQGLKVQNGLSIGCNSPTSPDVWMEKASVDQNGNITTTGPLSASNMYNKSQVDGLLANKANASDVYTKGQVGGLIPNLLYGVMTFYDKRYWNMERCNNSPNSISFCNNAVNISNKHTDHYDDDS